MLYIIGGAARSGKTLLSKRMLLEKHIPYFPIDALIGTLTEGAAELEINHNQPFITKSQKIWRLTKHLFNFFISEELSYIVEGDAILPSQIHELTEEGKEIKACFMGYTQLNVNEKLKLIRKYGEGKNDWTNGQSDEALIPMLERMIEYSKYLYDECQKYKIEFFDVSTNFENSYNEAFDYLTKK